jgi:hypothetical protein
MVVWAGRVQGDAERAKLYRVPDAARLSKKGEVGRSWP